MFNDIANLFSLLDHPQRRKLIKMQLYVIVLSFMELATILMIGYLVKMAINLDDLKNLSIFGYLNAEFNFMDQDLFAQLFFLVGLLSIAVTSFFSMIVTWKLSIFSTSIGADIGSRLFLSVSMLDWSLYVKFKSASIYNSLITETHRLTMNYIMPLARMNARLIVNFIILIGLLVYSPILTLLLAMIFLLSYFLLFKLVKAKLVSYGDGITHNGKKRFSIVNDALRNAKLIKLKNKQYFFSKLFNDVNKKIALLQGKSQALVDVPRYFMEFVILSAIIAVVLYLSYLSEEDLQRLIPELAVFAVAGLKVMPGFQQVYRSLGMLKANRSALVEIVDMCHQSPVQKSGADHLEKIPLQDKIILKNICYQYPNSDHYALNDMSIEIDVNTTVGIVGVSGSGKSTLMDILLGLVSPSKGALIVDGQPITEHNRRGWSLNAGYVPQEVCISDASLRANVAFAQECDKISDHKVRQAIIDSDMEDYLLRQRESLDAPLGEGGGNLSGGQKQRIAIARALYDDSGVLFFDEATSALDNIAEQAIKQTINRLKGKKTIFVITHKIEFLKDVDMVLVLDEGKLEAVGSYQELLSSNKKFQTLNLMI